MEPSDAPQHLGTLTCRRHRRASIEEEFAVLTRLSPSTLNDDCYRALKAAILDLTLAPGTPIVENAIAAQLGTSKTPVREALARLASEGFIVTDRSRRSHVAGLSIETVREIYAVRALLESAAIRHVATRMTDQDLDAVEASISGAMRALDREDLGAFLDANDGFHMRLIACNRNQYLIGIAERIFDQVRRVRSALYRYEPAIDRHAFSRRGVENHREILRALAARDPEQSAALMAADVRMFVDLMDTPTVREALLALSGQATTRDP